MCVAVFILGSKPNDISILQEAGCDSLFDRIAQPQFTDCFEGPCGSGKLIYANRGVPVSEYRPDLQQWLDCGKYWLGIWTNRKPTPELLQREIVLDGQLLRLCDGNMWSIPIVEYLPHRLTVDRTTGNEIRVVAPQHLDFAEWCNQLYRYFLSDEFQDRVKEEYVIHIENGLTFAAAALAKNYRVNRDLIDMLGLIEDHEAFKIAEVATGLALFNQLDDQKKTEVLAGVTS